MQQQSSYYAVFFVCTFLINCFIVNSAPGDRTFSFHNQCSETVWIGSTGGFTQDCNNGQCPAGQGCLTIRNPPGCFWTLPTNNIPSVSPGQTIQVDLNNPAYRGVKWSGNVYGKTKCDNSGHNCQTGDCGQCLPGMGPGGPTALAEFTLLYSTADTYDISLINGINLPIGMAPSPGQNLPPPNGNDYWCGNPGSRTPSNSALVGCSWNFNPVINGMDLSSYLYIVPEGGRTCTSNSNCAGGQVCGLPPSKGTRVCGNLIGYWTADEICGGTNYGFPVNCSNGVPGQGSYSSLYGCSGPNSQSCYQHNAPGNCCGCPNWVFQGKTLPSGPCQNSNPYWKSIAEPFARFVKAACPMAYSFPYDDFTSTFQCTTNGNPNQAGYTITFCP